MPVMATTASAGAWFGTSRRAAIRGGAGEAMIIRSCSDSPTVGGRGRLVSDRSRSTTKPSSPVRLGVIAGGVVPRRTRGGLAAHQHGADDRDLEPLEDLGAALGGIDGGLSRAGDQDDTV